MKLNCAKRFFFFNPKTIYSVEKCFIPWEKNVVKLKIQ